MDVVYPAFNAVEGVLKGLLPLYGRVLLWGALSGIAAMLIYAFVSNQEALRRQKRLIRESRERLRTEDMDPKEAVRASLQNLAHAFGLLGRVLPPALLSAVPVVLVMVWLTAYYSEAVVLEGWPRWMRTWEFPYFLGVLLSAGALKVVFRLE